MREKLQSLFIIWFPYQQMCWFSFLHSFGPVLRDFGSGNSIVPLKVTKQWSVIETYHKILFLAVSIVVLKVYASSVPATEFCFVAANVRILAVPQF